MDRAFGRELSVFLCCCLPALSNRHGGTCRACITDVVNEGSGLVPDVGMRAFESRWKIMWICSGKPACALKFSHARSLLVQDDYGSRSQRAVKVKVSNAGNEALYRIETPILRPCTHVPRNDHTKYHSTTQNLLHRIVLGLLVYNNGPVIPAAVTESMFAQLLLCQNALKIVAPLCFTSSSVNLNPSPRRFMQNNTNSAVMLSFHASLSDQKLSSSVSSHV